MVKKFMCIFNCEGVVWECRDFKDEEESFLIDFGEFVSLSSHPSITLGSIRSLIAIRVLI